VTLELIPTSKSPPDNNILEGTTGQPSIGYLRATIPPTRLKTIRRGLLGAFKLAQSYFSFGAQIGPRGVRIKAKGPKIGTRSYNVSRGLGPRPMGPSAQPCTIANYD